MSDDVLAILRGLQAGRTDREMAANLGISRSYWTHIRAGRRALSLKVARRAMQAFPDIRPAVVKAILDEPCRQKARAS